MRNAILPAAAVLLLGGAAMAQTGINSGTTLNQDTTCSSYTDADARTRCLNEMQLGHRDTTSGGMGGTGINSGASSSGAIESNRAGAENAVPGVGVGVNTGAGARVNTGANTGVNTGIGTRALGGDASGGPSAGGSVGTSERHRR